jgi:membrane protein YdbS with pleckstrin-like domain
LIDELSEGVLGEHRPVPQLMKYYAIESLILGPFFLLVLLPRIFRYRSLRYRFDEEGVSMAWGILFHRQVSLTYGRIQDIHLQSNLVERRFGLAKVKIQTAAGSATAEMTIEGLRNYEQVRDFLYSRMRGARGFEATSPEPTAGVESTPLVAALDQVTEEVRGLRRDLENWRKEEE